MAETKESTIDPITTVLAHGIVLLLYIITFWCVAGSLVESFGIPIPPPSFAQSIWVLGIIHIIKRI